MASASVSQARFAGPCSVSGRAERISAAASTRAARKCAANPARAFRAASLRDAGTRASRRVAASTRASLMEPEQATYQRRPEDVVASNGREVEQFALEACVRRQTSGERVPPPKINDDTLDDAFEHVPRGRRVRQERFTWARSS